MHTFIQYNFVCCRW